MDYQAVIGLEVHVQLKTRTKIFCACSTKFGQEPNSCVCPVCLGLPGSLPVLNKTALDYSVKVGIALNCQIQQYIKFDRKHYYYPDLPKNFQISQYELPIAKAGFLDIEIEGKISRIGIRRLHLEEDAGKLIHQDDISLLDYNRTGQPLLEIVSEPDINSAEGAYQYLIILKNIIQYLGVSDCDMEKGFLRCDANVSVREKTSNELGVKVELKNMNSFKAVKEALEFEIGRQIGLLEEKEAVVQETRLWDEKLGKSFAMRAKEEAKDYRYFPEPDLPPFVIAKDEIEEIRKTIPELPKEKMQRFIKEYGLTEYDARILVADKDNADYAEGCFNIWPDKNKKSVANWLIGPLAAIATSNNIKISELQIPTKDFLELVEYVEKKELISNLSGKLVLEEMAATKKSPAEIIRERNLVQISDEAVLKNDIEEVIRENPASVKEFKSGKENVLMFLVGQAMRKTKGKANPKLAQEILRRRLANA